MCKLGAVQATGVSGGSWVVVIMFGVFVVSGVFVLVVSVVVAGVAAPIVGVALLLVPGCSESFSEFSPSTVALCSESVAAASGVIVGLVGVAESVSRVSGPTGLLALHAHSSSVVATNIGQDDDIWLEFTFLTDILFMKIKGFSLFF